MSSTDQPAHTNQLIHETSPYLLQHAHNPVDWHPWGEEAIARARAEDKPIFLSIGYSACHWCHVMEHESFENERIAEILNRNFISIKVDREERPDLDDLYMQAVQMLTGRGGWPMSVFLTPELKPYFGGTYFPPEDGPRGMGFGSIAERLAEAYRIEKTQVAEGAEEITAAIAQQSEFARSESNEGISVKLIEQAAAALAREFDPIYGGFGGAPKFPPSMALNLLLGEAGRTGDLQSLKIAETTLERMVNGGIFDQLLGGFHRYSTDHHWLVPHFEKMLYDNALLVIPLLDAHLLTKNQSHLTAAQRTLDYILRDMTDPGGAFYSTEDADSEGVEGKFYVWDPNEVLSVLGPDDGTLFCDYYDVTPHGNFEGKSILHVITPLEEFALRRQTNAADLEARLESSRQKLEAVRLLRVHPGKDDKVVTAWNGMMISAMARAAQVTGDDRYRTAAQNAAKFLLGSMRKPDGTLLRTWRQGKANRIDGFIEDYAHLAVGLVDLYETDFDPAWLQAAESLAYTMLDRFADLENGGFYTSDGRDPSLLVRRKDFYDGATPSGNSAATHALLRLSILLDQKDFRDHAQKTMNAMHTYLTRLPGAVHHMLCAVALSLDRVKEIVILGDPSDPRTQELLRVVRSRHLPSRAIACASPDAIGNGFNPNIALFKDRSPIAGAPTAFVCENYTCQKPVTSPEELAAQL